MTEITTQNEAYLQRQKEDYANMAVLLARELRSRLGSILFGPTYKIATKQGANLTMQTYQLTNAEGKSTNIIIALDQNGAVVGHRIAHLEEDEDHINERGSIYIARRGEGIAKPVELVNLHFLQIEADRKQKDIHSQGYNRNADRLKHVQETIVSERAAHLPLTYDPTLLEDLTVESQRWHNLYGPNGSLGYDFRLRKVLSHNGTKDNFDASATIKLDSGEAVVNERRVTVPYVVAVQQDSLEQRAVFEKRTLLQERILPQLEALAA